MSVQLGISDTYEAAGERPADPLLRRRGGALPEDGRTVTVVGTADFMTNSGLLEQGNAALAMNLAGTHPRVIWYAPQRIEG